MSQSPVQNTNDPGESYLDAWQELAVRIRNGNSFSGREPNSVFLNTRGARFADCSMMSGLGLPDDARALAVSDWDRDGDLDLWVSNRTAPRVRLMRNDYANSTGMKSVALKLEGDPSKLCPRDAIGATVTLTLTDGSMRVRQLTAGDGFVSQSSKWLHFGMGQNGKIKSMQVRWPGSTEVESITPVGPGRWTIRQGEGGARGVAPSAIEVPIRELVPPPAQPEAEVVLTTPRDAPVLAYRSWTNQPGTIDTRPLTLTVLWASWCQPCLKEMSDLVKARPALEAAGIEVIALNIEEAQAELEGGEAPPLSTLQRSLTKLGWPFASGRATVSLVEALDNAQRSVLYKQESLPLPCSFLWRDGKLVSFAKGAVSSDGLLKLKQRLDVEPAVNRPDHAVPLAGRWSTSHFVTNPVAIARVYLEDSYTEAARQYLEDALKKLDASEDAQRRAFQESDLEYMLGEVDRMENKAPAVALKHYERAYKLHPDHPSAVLQLARTYSALKRGDEAVGVLQRFLRDRPERDDVAVLLGDTLQGLGRDGEATLYYQRVLKAKPEDFGALNQLCWVYATSGDASVRDARKALPLAQRVMRRYGNNPHALDSAAAALACGRQFEKAVELLERALPLAQRRRDAGFIRDLQRRLALYRAGRPFVRSKGS